MSTFFCNCAAKNAAPEGSVSFLAARLHKTFAEGCNEAVSLCPAPSMAETMRPRRLRKTFTSCRIWLAHILANRPGVRKVKVACGAAGESIGDESGLIGPPAVDGSFANVQRGRQRLRW